MWPHTYILSTRCVVGLILIEEFLPRRAIVRHQALLFEQEILAR